MRGFIARHFDRKVVIWIVCLLIVSLFGYLIFNSYNVYVMTSEDCRAVGIDAIGQRMESLFLEINDFPQDEGNDILYLGKINSLHQLLNEGDARWDENKEKLANDFLNCMEVNSAYYQLRYIDEGGIEVIRVENDGENLFIVEEKALQNKKDRYYFEDIMSLNKDEIYVSKLDLNIENKVLENRGTESNPEYVPVIRYSMPVFDYNEVKRGFLIFNIYADYFLEDIRRMDNEAEFSFLVDNDGYYLAHPNRSKEFSFMFGEEERIDLDYGDVGREILKGFEKRVIETEDNLFIFRHLYPTDGTFEIYQGSKKIFGENPEDEHYWVLVSVSHSDAMKGNIKNIKNNFIIFLTFSALLILLIVTLLIVILVMNGNWRR